MMGAVKTIYLVVIAFLLEENNFATGTECGAVSRNEWGALTHKPLVTMSTPTDLVVILHTVSRGCGAAAECAQAMRDIQKWHVNQRHYDDIGLSFAVGGDGQVYEGRGWGRAGAHTLRYNDKSIGIGFIGDFRDKIPVESALNATKDFLKCGVEKGHLSPSYRLVGHRQLTATQSPGDRLYEEIKTWQHWKDL